jgi:hypothetical protein
MCTERGDPAAGRHAAPSAASKKRNVCKVFEHSLGRGRSARVPTAQPLPCRRGMKTGELPMGRDGQRNKQIEVTKTKEILWCKGN